MKRFHVIETKCWPCKWKVESIQWPGTDNSTPNYFHRKEDAEKEAGRRNDMLELEDLRRELESLSDKAE